MIGVQAGFVLSGAVYIETVFQWPGVGRMLVPAILTRDILLGFDPVLKGIEAAAAADPQGPEALLLRAYAVPLDWYRTGRAHVDALDAAAPPPPDPAFDRKEVKCSARDRLGLLAPPVPS